MLAAELNSLNIMVGDISSAYLEAYTQEKVCFLAGPEFGPLQGHLMIIERALYGLRTSGARWHDRFSDTLRDLSFTPCEADPDVWIRPTDTHYEYVCVYVDDIMMFGSDPSSFFTSLLSELSSQIFPFAFLKAETFLSLLRSIEMNKSWSFFLKVFASTLTFA
jgi:hypothetical protein